MITADVVLQAEEAEESGRWKPDCSQSLALSRGLRV